MDVKGKVHEISDVMNVTETFRKRELIIEIAENPQYPEYVKFEATQDRCSLIDPLKVGDDVEVFFNLRGRPWTDPKTGRKAYFNTLNLWRINVLGAEAGAPAAAAAPQFAPPVDVSAAPGEDDDLPF